jgi:hypothetical protein
MELERRRGEAAQRGQGLLPGRQDSQGRGGGLPKGQTVFLVDGTAVNIDDATVEMGALGTNQIPYQDLSQRQKVVRDLSVKRLRERERAGGRGRGWAPGSGKGGKGVYEHPHARGRGRGERRGNMELCPESERNYITEVERTLREQEAQRRGSGAGGTEQAQSATPGDEDGQDDRVEQERTDAQANPGADIEMGAQAAAAARAELTEASGTPLPGGAGGGGGSESDGGGEPEPKRRQTMEDVEDEAGIGVMPARSREQAREVGSDGIRKAAPSGGFLKKRNAAKKKAAEAAEAAAAAAATAAAGGGGSAMGEGNAGNALTQVHGKATMHKGMGPPPPRGKGRAEGATAAAPSSMGAGTPPGLRLPDAVTYETGIASGSEYTVESEGHAHADARMERGTGAAAAGPAPWCLGPPMPGSGAAGGGTAAEGTAEGMDTQEDPGAGMHEEVPPPPPLPPPRRSRRRRNWWGRRKQRGRSCGRSCRWRCKCKGSGAMSCSE